MRHSNHKYVYASGRGIKDVLWNLIEMKETNHNYGNFNTFLSIIDRTTGQKSTIWNPIISTNRT